MRLETTNSEAVVTRLRDGDVDLGFVEGPTAPVGLRSRLVITAAILGVLRSAIRRVGARLLDAVDPELLDRVQASVEAVPGVLGVESLQLRWIGHCTPRSTSPCPPSSPWARATSSATPSRPR